MKYVIYCDGNAPAATAVNSVEEAMVAFDRMTMLFNYYNNCQEEDKYLTCAEMGITTPESFLKEMLNWGTVDIYCCTVEDFLSSLAESFKDIWDDFQYEN